MDPKQQAELRENALVRDFERMKAKTKDEGTAATLALALQVKELTSSVIRAEGSLGRLEQILTRVK